MIKYIKTVYMCHFPDIFLSYYLYIFFSHLYFSLLHPLFLLCSPPMSLSLSFFSLRPLASRLPLLPRQDQSQISSRAGSYPSRFLRHLYPFFISFFYPINRHTSLHLPPFRLLPLSPRIGCRFCLRFLAWVFFPCRG